MEDSRPFEGGSGSGMGEADRNEQPRPESAASAVPENISQKHTQLKKKLANIQTKMMQLSSQQRDEAGITDEDLEKIEAGIEFNDTPDNLTAEHREDDGQTDWAKVEQNIDQALVQASELTKKAEVASMSEYARQKMQELIDVVAAKGGPDGIDRDAVTAAGANQAELAQVMGWLRDVGEDQLSDRMSVRELRYMDGNVKKITRYSVHDLNAVIAILNKLPDNGEKKTEQSAEDISEEVRNDAEDVRQQILATLQLRDKIGAKQLGPTVDLAALQGLEHTAVMLEDPNEIRQRLQKPGGLDSLRVSLHNFRQTNERVMLDLEQVELTNEALSSLNELKETVAAIDNQGALTLANVQAAGGNQSMLDFITDVIKVDSQDQLILRADSYRQPLTEIVARLKKADDVLGKIDLEYEDGEKGVEADAPPVTGVEATADAKEDKVEAEPITSSADKVGTEVPPVSKPESAPPAEKIDADSPPKTKTESGTGEKTSNETGPGRVEKVDGNTIVYEGPGFRLTLERTGQPFTSPEQVIHALETAGMSADQIKKFADMMGNLPESDQNAAAASTKTAEAADTIPTAEAESVTIEDPVTITAEPEVGVDPTEHQQKMEQAQLEWVAEMRQRQEVAVAEIEQLWKAIPADVQKFEPFTWQDVRKYIQIHGNLDGYLDQGRADVKNRNDNRREHKQTAEAGLDKILLDRLLNEQKLLVAEINSKHPGRAGLILDQLEVNQRADKKFIGRTGEVELPKSEKVVGKMDLDKIKTPAEVRDDFMAMAPDKVAEQKQMTEIMDKLSQLGADGKPVDAAKVEQIISSLRQQQKYDEFKTNPNVVKRAVCKLPNGVVLEMIKMNNDYRYLGVANIETRTNPGSELIADRGQLQKINMDRLRGDDLWNDTAGRGRQETVYIESDKGELLKLAFDAAKGGWMLTGRSEDKPVNLMVSEENMRKLNFHKGEAFMVKGLPSIQVAEFSLDLGPASKSIAKEVLKKKDQKAIKSIPYDPKNRNATLKRKMHEQSIGQRRLVGRLGGRIAGAAKRSWR